MSDPKYRNGLTGPSTDVWLAILRRQKLFAENAFNQLDDDAFFRRPELIAQTRLNSIAIIVRHLAGNMKSRWTDFLTADGEKSWRDREVEFREPEHSPAERAAIMRDWDAGWALVDNTISSLSTDDLRKTVVIRSKPHSVEASVVRQIDHYATHVGQIVTTARLFIPESEWQYFTLKPGESSTFNASMTEPDA